MTIKCISCEEILEKVETECKHCDTVITNKHSLVDGLCDDCIPDYEEVVAFGDEYTYATIGEHSGEPLCWDCESDDLAEAVVSAKKTSDGETYCCGNYTSYAEDSDIESYFDTVKWTSTDAWRGYYSGKCPPGYKEVANTWFCGTDGFSPSDEFDALHSLFESDKLDDLDVIYAFPRTSNVFSTGLEVYVRYNHVELFKSLLKEV